MLSIRRLTFAYANSDGQQPMHMCFDLEVGAGEVLSLIGPSGSGKSTLLSLIGGFIRASSGQILVEEQEIHHLKPAERPVTIVFQQHNLFPHLDVFTNIALGLEPSLKLSQIQLDAISEALDNIGLVGFDKRLPGQLSGGQRQRVALARALVRKHDILLLDEPFAALGPAMREEMIELLQSLVEQQNMAALLVSHQPSDALLASKNTAFISNGKALVVEPTATLLNSSRYAEVNEYLGKS